MPTVVYVSIQSISGATNKRMRETETKVEIILKISG